jgi:hypothetical protein
LIAVATRLRLYLPPLITNKSPSLFGRIVPRAADHTKRFLRPGSAHHAVDDVREDGRGMLAFLLVLSFAGLPYSSPEPINMIGWRLNDRFEKKEES